MHSFFLRKMENNQATLVNMASTSSSTETLCGEFTVTDWQFFSEPVNIPPPPLDAPPKEFEYPFLREFASTGLFDGADTTQGSLGGGDCTQKIVCEEITRSCGVSEQMLQTSSGVTKPSSPSPTVTKPSSVVSGDMMKVTGGSPVRLLNHSRMHMSPPQTLGIKHRKGLARKVVCVPAPAAPNSKPGGEVVPCDLWAWRKYGQKPIKGSPYPRGYYRCSSSKGCPARKQVERSRTDPNVLVITYTSEHNHPWPTKRNALAGSTRPQTSKDSPNSQKPQSSVKEEVHETTSLHPFSISVEVQDMEKAMDLSKDNEFEEVFHQSYEYNQPNDFFTEFKELESDPMNLVFSRGPLVDKPAEERENKILEASNFFGWEGTSVGEAKKAS